MADTGLSDKMSSVFGGVSKMLTGKKFPQNVRALRMVAEEALRGIIQDKPLYCSGDLMQIFETEATKSQTTKLSVDVLIKPDLLTMMFVRAEREDDWQLHLATYKQLRVEDVYLIFDRYYDFSTKSVSRGFRATGVSRVYHLQVNSKLPAQKILLTSSKNKKQLVQLTVDDLVQDKKFHVDNTRHHKLVVTGADPVPIEMSEGEVVMFGNFTRRCR